VTVSMPSEEPPRRVIVGVDTHKHVHVAVAIDTLGVRVADRSFAADSGGYVQLAEWAEGLGRIDSFGIEGTGSYGAGLTSALRRRGHRIVEVNRGNRQARRTNGKSDTVDAEIAARQVLAGVAKAVPKTANGQVEMIRQLKVARDTAVKARTSAMITLKQVVVNAPPELREALAVLNDKALINRCAGFRVGRLSDTTASAKYSLRTLARRWLALNAEIVDADRHLDQLTTDVAPTMRQAFGIGPDTAAEMLVIFGDNPDRIRSDAAFAKLCGACPVPASSGMTSGRHRLYTGGHRQANAALYRSVIVRMRFHEPTIDYVNRRTAEGLGKREIIRCLKRFMAREIYQHVMVDHRARQAVRQAA
jgi:transposase